MIEPFRPLVDLYVSSHFDISEIDSTLTPEMKKGLFGIINFDMSVKGDMRIVSNCIDMLIASYSSALQGNRTELDLPELIQLQVHSYELLSFLIFRSSLQKRKKQPQNSGNF